MWWKMLLTGIVGFVAGAAVMCATINLMHSAVMGDRERTLPTRWSSAGKEWPKFAIWLRYGGRRDLSDAAFSATRIGVTEAKVRSTLGPPDSVFIGENELKGSPARFLGAAGAYLYKIGPAANTPDEVVYQVLAVIFGADGKVMYRFAFGVHHGSGLADIDKDTRSERSIFN